MCKENHEKEQYKNDIRKISYELSVSLEAVKKAMTIVSKIHLPEFKVPKIIISPEVLKRIEFVLILDEIKWPLFLEEDKDLIEKVVAFKKSTNQNKKQIEKIIYSYCNNRFINKLKIKWGTSYHRYFILREALEMHLSKKYLASTSLLMCQIYGLIKDIYSYANNNNIIFSEEDKERIIRDRNIKTLKNEKGSFYQLIEMPKGNLIWEAIGNYFQQEILSSPRNKKRWECQPNRNKICHGEQLNFGTIEHSLKAILCIDILISLDLELKRIVGLFQMMKTKETP